MSQDLHNVNRIDYYLQKLDNNKFTGRLFKTLPFPKIPLLIMPSKTFIIVLLTITLLLFAWLETYLHSFFLLGFLIIVLSWEYYNISHIRRKIMNHCLVTESIYQDDFKKGVHPEFPYDPLYVTKEDRDAIFEDGYHTHRLYFKEKIKYHYSIFLIMFSSFFLAYFLLSWLQGKYLLILNILSLFTNKI